VAESGRTYITGTYICKIFIYCRLETWRGGEGEIIRFNKMQRILTESSSLINNRGTKSSFIVDLF
jgi:hypothetical protein